MTDTDGKNAFQCRLCEQFFKRPADIIIKVSGTYFIEFYNKVHDRPLLGTASSGYYPIFLCKTCCKHHANMEDIIRQLVAKNLKTIKVKSGTGAPTI